MRAFVVVIVCPGADLRSGVVEPEEPPRRRPRPPQNPPQNAEADPGVVPRRLEFRRKLMKIRALSKSGVQVGQRVRGSQKL